MFVEFQNGYNYNINKGGINMKNKIETITIELRTDYAYQLALFLGVQDIEDTSYIINKYNLNMNKDEVDDILQNLFNKLCCELELEM